MKHGGAHAPGAPLVPTPMKIAKVLQQEGHAEAGKIIRFIRGKSTVVFHCSACVLQDFCNLLYT